MINTGVFQRMCLLLLLYCDMGSFILAGEQTTINGRRNEEGEAEDSVRCGILRTEKRFRKMFPQGGPHNVKYMLGAWRGGV